jgi:hypothetical protein
MTGEPVAMLFDGRFLVRNDVVVGKDDDAAQM